MSIDNEINGGEELSADDKAYFESGGKVDTAPGEEPVRQPEHVEDAPTDVAQPEQVQEEPQKVKTVPHQALHAEREEHKQTKAEVAQLREQLSRHEQRMNALLQQMQPQQQEQQPVEDDPMPPADDPIAKLEWLERQFEKQRQGTAEQQKAAQEQEAIQRHVYEVDYTLNQAIAADPTVKEAFDFGVDALRAHYAKQGVPPWDMEQYIRRDMQNYALKAPKGQAELVEYVKANARYFGWGYQQPAPAQQQQTTGDKIDKLQAAVNQNRSLSQAGGKAINLTAADIDSMSDDEFSEWLSKGGENAWRKANGL